MARKIKGYGWNPDMPDGRDFMYAAPPEVVAVAFSTIVPRLPAVKVTLVPVALPMKEPLVIVH